MDTVSVLISCGCGSENYLWLHCVESIQCSHKKFPDPDLLIFIRWHLCTNLNSLSFLYLSYLICLFVRFEKRIYIPLPEKNARTEIFKIHIGNTPNTLTDGDYRTLGAEAEG